MELEVVVRFLSEIVRFLFGTSLWCAVVQMASVTFGVTQTAYVIQPICGGASCNYIVANPIRYVGATDQETLVVTFAVPPSREHSCDGGLQGRCFYREIAKAGATGLDEPVRVWIPLTQRSGWTLYPQSEGLFVTGTDWWYATLDDRDDAAATTFVKSDGSSATHLRPQVATEENNQTHSNSWQLIVIPGEKPRVLELSYLAEETIAREVDWSGKSRWWRLPPVDYKRPSRMVAQPLPDGRIALLSNNDGLSLFLLADEGHVEAVTLRNVRIQQFDAAIDSTGRIAIVAARNAIVPARSGIAAVATDTGTIDAAIIDPSHPDHAEWSALRHDVQVTEVFGGAHIVTTPDGFAAAWVNELDGRRIEATAVDRRGHGGSIVDVGRASLQGQAPFLGLQASHDELLFWWDDGIHLFQRRLPASLEGYAALGDFARNICGTTEAHPEERKESRR